MKFRKLFALITSVVALLALSGCMRIHEDLTLHSDDTVSGSIIMAYDLAVLEMAGLSEDDLDALLAGEGITDLAGMSGEGVSVTEYNEDGFTGYLIEFTALPIADMASGAGITITREGDEFIVEADYSAIGADLEAVPTNMLASMDMRTTVTFPGAIIEQRGGEVAENTITWVTNFSDLGEVYGRAHATEGAGGGVPLLYIGVAAGLLVLLGIVIFLAVRLRKQQATDQGTGHFVSDPPAAEPYASGPYVAGG